jgi:hypothetical protein
MILGFFFISCLSKKSIKLSMPYTCDAHYDTIGKQFNWTPVRKIDPVKIEWKNAADTIDILYYYKDKPTRFIKKPLSQRDLKLVKKKINDFQFVGNYDKEDPDRINLLIYKNPSNEIFMELHTYVGCILTVIYYSPKNNNRLKDLKTYKDFINIDGSNK